MEPSRSHPPLVVDADQEGVHSEGDVDPAANDDETKRFRDFLWDYCHININNTNVRVATPTVVRRETDVIDVDDDAPQMQHEDDDVFLPLCQPSQRYCSKSQEAEEGTGIVAAQPMGMTFDSENIPNAGFNIPRPPPPLAGNNSNMFVAAAATADPLQLSLGTHAPIANHMSGSSSSITFSGYKGSATNQNQNLLPPKKKTVASASLSLTTKKPYELPLLVPPPFAPVILESSEVPSVNDMGPAKANHKRRRQYIWPASKVAKLDEKIEELRKEAHLRPAHRRPMMLIEKDIYELQGKKDEIHAKMLAAMREDDDKDEGTSTQ